MSKSKTAEARVSFKDLLGGEVKANIQKVAPTEKVDKKDETQLMVWIPTDLMVKLKTKTVIEKRSMKDIITNLLENNI